jgi:hypothetical protein
LLKRETREYSHILPDTKDSIYKGIPITIRNIADAKECLSRKIRVTHNNRIVEVIRHIYPDELLTASKEYHLSISGQYESADALTPQVLTSVSVLLLREVDL